MYQRPAQKFELGVGQMRGGGAIASQGHTGPPRSRWIVQAVLVSK